jgi:hypothetical protein
VDGANSAPTERGSFLKQIEIVFPKWESRSNDSCKRFHGTVSYFSFLIDHKGHEGSRRKSGMRALRVTSCPWWSKVVLIHAHALLFGEADKA